MVFFLGFWLYKTPCQVRMNKLSLLEFDTPLLIKLDSNSTHWVRALGSLMSWTMSLGKLVHLNLVGCVKVNIFLSLKIQKYVRSFFIYACKWAELDLPSFKMTRARTQPELEWVGSIWTQAKLEPIPIESYSKFVLRTKEHHVSSDICWEKRRQYIISSQKNF